MFNISKKLTLLLVCIQTTIPVMFIMSDDNCGLRKISRSPKIVNGKDAYHGQYPWAISLRIHGRHHCGGAMIDHDTILTAAHCVSKINHRAFTVRLGSHYRNTDREATSVEVKVKTVIPHEQFTFTSFANDIGLVKLAKSVNYTNYISPVCLPFSDDSDYVNDTGIVVGWGKLTPLGASASTLQELELPIIDNAKCIKWYEDQGKSVPIRSTQLCAGFEAGGKDACQGDSGSPLMRIDPTTGQLRVIGIVSAGIGCALPKLPGLYTRVSSYIPWINQHINDVIIDKIIPDKVPYDPVIRINKTSNVITINTGINNTEFIIDLTNITKPHFNNLTDV